MLKAIGLIPRRHDFTPKQFYERWLKGHAPLVAKHSRDLRMLRYVQSHKVPSPILDQWASGREWAVPPEFDGITEVWWESEADMAAALASPEGGRASAILKADEAEFCDMSRVSVIMTTEHVIFDYLP
jgi:hypothetical protein